MSEDGNRFSQQQAARVIGPKRGEVLVLAVSDSQANTDLATLLAAIGGLQNRILTFKADGCAVYFQWAADGTGAAVNPTATGLSDQTVHKLDNGERFDLEQPDPSLGFIRYITDAGDSGFLRIFVSSEAP